MKRLYSAIVLVLLVIPVFSYRKRPAAPGAVRILYFEDLHDCIITTRQPPASILYEEYADQLLQLELSDPNQRKLTYILLKRMLRRNHPLDKKYGWIFTEYKYWSDTLDFSQPSTFEKLRDPHNYRRDTVLTDSQIAVVLEQNGYKDTVFMDYFRPGNIEYRKKGYVDSLFFEYIASMIYQQDESFGHQEFYDSDDRVSKWIKWSELDNLQGGDTLYCLKREYYKKNLKRFESLLR